MAKQMQIKGYQNAAFQRLARRDRDAIKILSLNLN